MAFVLKEVSDRSGSVKRFDVVRAENGADHDILEGIAAGEYRIFDGTKVRKVKTSYRTIQDIETVEE